MSAEMCASQYLSYIADVTLSALQPSYYYRNPHTGPRGVCALSASCLFFSGP